MKTAVVVGCGGPIGGAWAIAALHAMAEQTGLEPRDVDLIYVIASTASENGCRATGLGGILEHRPRWRAAFESAMRTGVDHRSTRANPEPRRTVTR